MSGELSPQGDWGVEPLPQQLLPVSAAGGGRRRECEGKDNITVSQAQYHFCVSKNITPSGARYITISLQVKEFYDIIRWGDNNAGQHFAL